MRLHWHLGADKKRTACGMYAYPTDVAGEYNTATNDRIECATVPGKVTCLRCQRVMEITQAR